MRALGASCSGSALALTGHQRRIERRSLILCCHLTFPFPSPPTPLSFPSPPTPLSFLSPPPPSPHSISVAMDRQQQQLPQGDAELPPTGPVPLQQGRLELYREHHRQAMERHRHTVSYRVPVERQQAQMLQQRFLPQGGGAQKPPPVSGGRGGAADKSQGGGGVEADGSEHGTRLPEEGLVSARVQGGYSQPVTWAPPPIAHNDNCLFVNSVECGGML